MELDGIKLQKPVALIIFGGIKKKLIKQLHYGNKSSVRKIFIVQTI
jgi:hypothetical protein